MHLYSNTQNQLYKQLESQIIKMNHIWKLKTWLGVKVNEEGDLLAKNGCKILQYATIDSI
jgi:hypothetical protein